MYGAITRTAGFIALFMYLSTTLFIAYVPDSDHKSNKISLENKARPLPEASARPGHIPKTARDLKKNSIQY